MLQLPYCLLRARQTFIYDANHNPADYGENMGRGDIQLTDIPSSTSDLCYNCSATACEVIARRIVRLYDSQRLNDVMSSRYRHIDRDGDPSAVSSALELAVDQHA